MEFHSFMRSSFMIFFTYEILVWFSPPIISPSAATTQSLSILFLLHGSGYHSVFPTSFLYSCDNMDGNTSPTVFCTAPIAFYVYPACHLELSKASPSFDSLQNTFMIAVAIFPIGHGSWPHLLFLDSTYNLPNSFTCMLPFYNFSPSTEFSQILC